MSTLRPTAVAATGNPYVGLDFFTEEDAAVFFGRDDERKTIIGNLRASRLTLLYAQSGVGKSSLLRAGVAARLRELGGRSAAESGSPRVVPVVVSRWSDDPVTTVVDEIERAVRPFVAAASGIELPRDRLDEAIERAAAAVDATPLIILDQFEDYFVYHADEDGHGTFGSEFPRLVERSDLRANFLISIREDALARLDRFKGRIPGLFDNYLRVEPLSRAEAREAIVRPIDRYNEGIAAEQSVTIEPDLVGAVLTELAAGDVILGAPLRAAGTARETASDVVEAPFLQLVMTRLWTEEMDSGSRTLRRSTLERLGGAGSIVRTHLDSVLSALDEAEQAVAARIFQQLVTPSGNKIALSVADLAQLSDQPQERVAAVVERLAGGDVRILRPVARTGAGVGRFEIFHDVLAQAVLDWHTRYVRDQRERRLEADRRLAEEERRRELKNRFFRILALALLVAVIGTAALTVFALRERDKARSSALVAHSVAAVAGDPELGVLLAREGMERAQSDEAADALVGALSDMHLVATMRGHSEGLVATPRDGSAFTPDGARVVTASGDSAAIWSGESGALLHSLTGHRDRVFSASFRSDGAQVVTASEDGTAKIWDAKSGRLVHTLRGPQTGVNGAQFSADGRRVVTSGGIAPRAQVWAAGTGRLLRTIPTRAPVYAAVFDRRGEHVLTSEVDNTARIWDAQSGRLLRELRGHDNAVYGATFDRDGRRVATSSLDGTARLWNARTGALVARLGAIEQTAPAMFSRDGRLVLTTGERAAHVWSATTGTRVASLQGHADALSSSSFSPDGTRVATASEDQTAIVWDLAAERPFRVLRGHTGAVMSAAFMPSGRTLVTVSEDRTARTWDADSGIMLRAHDDAVRSVSFSPDGRLLASAGEDNTARLWNVRGRLGPGPVLHHRAAINRVAFNGDGTQVVTASSDRTASKEMIAAVWNARTGERVQRFRVATTEPGDAINAAAFRPDGKAVILATAFVGVQIFDAATGRKLRVLQHEDVVYDASFSADGKRIVTADLDGTARIWDAAGGGPMAVLRGHRGSVLTASFSPDGRFVVTGSSDRTAILWATASGRRLRVLAGHTAQVNAARFSPDGRRVVTAGDTTTRVWETGSGRLLGILRAHADVVRDVAPRGDLIASASDDRTVRLYRCHTCVPIRELTALATRRVTRSLTSLERQRFLGDD